MSDHIPGLRGAPPQSQREAREEAAALRARIFALEDEVAKLRRFGDQAVADTVKALDERNHARDERDQLQADPEAARSDAFEAARAASFDRQNLETARRELAEVKAERDQYKWGEEHFRVGMEACIASENKLTSDLAQAQASCAQYRAALEEFCAATVGEMHERDVGVNRYTTDRLVFADEAARALLAAPNHGAVVVAEGSYVEGGANPLIRICPTHHNRERIEGCVVCRLGAVQQGLATLQAEHAKMVADFEAVQANRAALLADVGRAREALLESREVYVSTRRDEVIAALARWTP